MKREEKITEAERLALISLYENNIERYEVSREVYKNGGFYKGDHDLREYLREYKPSYRYWIEHSNRLKAGE